MMGWERPVMKRVSEIITFNQGRVLNIGFGMGIVDSFIQERNPLHHTIIENHPDVYTKMVSDGWLEKENVSVICDKWQNVIEVIGKFDGIYLDTWYDNRTFYVKNLLDNCLKEGGVFSIWYNEEEFNDILKRLPDCYEVDYEYIKNDGLIPSKKEQYENGGCYIDPNVENIVIPIIRRLN